MVEQRAEVAQHGGVAVAVGEDPVEVVRARAGRGSRPGTPWPCSRGGRRRRRRGESAGQCSVLMGRQPTGGSGRARREARLGRAGRPVPSHRRRRGRGGAPIVPGATRSDRHDRREDRSRDRRCGVTAGRASGGHGRSRIEGAWAVRLRPWVLVAGAVVIAVVVVVRRASPPRVGLGRHPVVRPGRLERSGSARRRRIRRRPAPLAPVRRRLCRPIDRGPPPGAEGVASNTTITVTFSTSRLGGDVAPPRRSPPPSAGHGCRTAPATLTYQLDSPADPRRPKRW